MAPSSDPEVVDFWFDPACPWAWLTSRWMLQVREVRPVAVRWRLMSLAVLNADKLDAEVAAMLWAPVRVLAAAEAGHGADALEPLYTALGTLRHHEKRDLDAEGLTEALARAGLPTGLAAAAGDDRLDAAVTASHQEAMSLVGDDVGTPVLRIGSVGIFGPVVSPVPRGERAGQIWDAARTLTLLPEFFELKRTRQAPPELD